MRHRLIIAGLLWLLTAGRAHALDVFACEPEWGALATEIGGDAADVFTATTARQDPHQIQARPALIARLRAADLVVCTGAELEIGWMPVLLRQGANAKVQPGSPGYFEAASAVRLLDIPTRLDRADGDVHAAGNPHIQTAPANIRAVGIALALRMAEIDPGHAALYRERERAFRARLDAAMARWTTEAAPLRGSAVAVQHRDWRYLLDWLGMTEAATLEPKPGVPPSAGYLAGIIDGLPGKNVRMILYAAYQDAKPSEFVAAKTGIPAVELPFTVGGTDQAGDLIALYDDTIGRLLAHADKH
ncbi:zinc ABC transporter substrate-binding protein [Magnetospirillum sp. 15-1]|uniref:metal ABC transporter substrate-binding protein n=1 Tax=Magnetospirillum sp. 15-1 TaxID=1979370 RepID=UPI000BBCC88C|nr:zinc ABC transporter substrate-binding protein [Magnetospirillum sp. 15-1]